MGEVIVGIDLGTTNSLVAVWEGGSARVIPDEAGRGLLPSVVRYEEIAAESAERTEKSKRAGSESGSRSVNSVISVVNGLRAVVGYEAKEHAAEFPATTVYSVKRLMGRSRADGAGDLPYLSYKVVEGPHSTARIELPLRERKGGLEARPPLVVSPQEVSAAILRVLKDRASGALGVEVRRAVVTVPAYFDNAQREATKDAGRIAGLEVVRIVPEPTAAALAYGLGMGGAMGGHHRAAGDEDEEVEKRGAASGGAQQTRTIAVFDLGGGTFDISILRLTARDGTGGMDFFQVLATAGDTHLGGDDVDQMLVERFMSEMGAAVSAGGRQALRAAAEAAKCRLSEVEETTIEAEVDGRQFGRPLTRAELEALVGPWVERTIQACDRALRDARRHVGGLDARPPTGIDAVIMVGGATRMPIVRRRVRDFFGIEPYTAIDPDRVVALGAAVQAGILAGDVQGALLLDVIPLSLGIETVGGAVAKIIFKNSTVPARATEMFSTSVDGQASIKIQVLQGEREMAADCRSLGVFHLRGIPRMPAGIPQVEVEFLVDANGVLNVSAQERRSGRRSSLQVVPNHGLTREEVEKIEASSLEHAREDMTRHRIVDLVANAKLDLKWIREGLEKHARKLETTYAKDLGSRIADLRGMVERAEQDWQSVDADEFHRAKEALDRASVRLQEVSITESLRESSPQRTPGTRAKTEAEQGRDDRG